MIKTSNYALNLIIFAELTETQIWMLHTRDKHKDSDHDEDLPDFAAAKCDSYQSVMSNKLAKSFKSFQNDTFFVLKQLENLN